MYQDNLKFNLKQCSLTSLTDSELTETFGGDAPHHYVGYAFGLYWKAGYTVAKDLSDAFCKWRAENIEKYGTAGH